MVLYVRESDFADAPDGEDEREKTVKLIDALLGEHGAYYALFNAIEKMADTEGELAQIESATAALAAELDTHATFEEDVLFPALEPHMENDDLISELCEEHKAIQAGLRRIEDARDIREAMDAVQQTLSKARRHFSNEEEILYPLARRMLDEKVLTQLGDTWAAARKVKAG